MGGNWDSGKHIITKLQNLAQHPTMKSVQSMRANKPNTLELGRKKEYNQVPCCELGIMNLRTPGKKMVVDSMLPI